MSQRNYLRLDNLSHGLTDCLSRQSRTTMSTQDVGETINATNIVEGISPHWNEMIYVNISEDSSNSEGKRKI